VRLGGRQTPRDAGARTRWQLIEGKAVRVIICAAEGNLFDGFLPKAQEVLDTVEWEGA
jgi:hypothetical protein